MVCLSLFLPLTFCGALLMPAHILAGKFIAAASASGASELQLRPAIMRRTLPQGCISSWQLLLALLLCLLQLRHAAAQTGPEYDWMDGSYSTEYRAASVVTNLWIAAFAVTSALFGLLGELGMMRVQCPILERGGSSSNVCRLTHSMTHCT
jgi:hypothetical protein